MEIVFFKTSLANLVLKREIKRIINTLNIVLNEVNNGFTKLIKMTLAI